jgi:hypothetical protein
VPRHEFVPVEVQHYAYLNRPLPIGFDKTTSQPLMVAVMTDLLEVKPDDAVLEIGTGLVYQSAVLAELIFPSRIGITFSMCCAISLSNSSRCAGPSKGSMMKMRTRLIWRCLTASTLRSKYFCAFTVSA